MAGPGLVRHNVATEIPDYVGHYLDVAFAHAVRRNLGIPRLVDGRGNKVRVNALGLWKVVGQSGTAGSLVFVIEASH